MTDSSDTIKQMIKLIEQEAQEKALQIVEDGKHRMHIDKNKIFVEEREKLLNEYKKKTATEKQQSETLKSRMINKSRLNVQSKRLTLLSGLKDFVISKLSESLKDKKVYNATMKKMIIQGLIRLMEKQINLRCKTEDEKYIESVLPEIQKEYNEFMKAETGREFASEITIIKDFPLSDKETKLGGVMMYCQRNRIVFTNTFESRYELAFAESMPDIRKGLFGNN